MKSILITYLISFLFLTTVTGQEWELQYQGIRDSWEIIKTEHPLNDVYFIDRDTGFLASGSSRFHFWYGILLFTQNGGLTWNSLLDSIYNPTEFYFINEKKAYVTTIGNKNGAEAAYMSSDGGYSWSEDTTIWKSKIIFFLNDSLGWYINYLSVYKTIDGGQNWEEFINLSKLLNPDENLNSLFFIDENNGYLVGDGGAIIEISDKEELRRIKTGTTLPLNKIEFINNKIGWIAGGYRNDEGFGAVFLRTEDGGENWIETTEIDYLFNDFYFKDILRGWAVGESSTGGGMVLGTIDGGDTWITLINILSAPLNAIHFKDNVGWAVGDNGLILKMIDTTATFVKAEIVNNTGNIQLQNYPNPFHSRTMISYQLPKSSEVELNIYDLFGRKMATLLQEHQPPGSYAQDWNAETMQPGIYICELRTGRGRQVLKMILMN